MIRASRSVLTRWFKSSQAREITVLVGGAAMLAAGLGPACGGKVIVDGAPGASGGGGDGGSQNVTTTTIVSSSSVTTTVTTTTTTATTTTTTTTTSSTTGVGGAPPIPPLVETDYGDVPLGSTIDFDVPPGTVGMTVIVEPPGTYDQVGVETITPPAGPPVVTNYHMPGTGWDFAWYGITVAGIPMSDVPSAMPVVDPGVWQFKLGDYAATGAATAKVSVWRRQTLDGMFHGGLLDVNVFIAGSATSESYMLDLLQESYGEYAGLNLGTVTFTYLPDQFQVIDGLYGFFDMLEQTEGAAGKPALNILAVSVLTGDLEGAAGVAAGIPGIGLKHGTHSSGVIMTVYHEPYFDRIILRHEAGHLAGLLHTTEIEGGFTDALSDTPECPNIEDGGNCPDEANIMFPYGGAGDLFSPKQMRVIQGSSLYRGFVEVGGGPPDPLPLPPPGPSPNVSPPPSPPIATSPLVATQGPWASGISPALARALAGTWCSDPKRRVDHFAALRRLGATDAAQLLAIAADDTAPIQARRHALSAAGRATPTQAQIAELTAIAERKTAPRFVRVGALEALRAAAPPRARAAAARLGADADPVIAQLAARLR